MASSSKTTSASSSAPQRKYDVFLSFRGPDTRKNITSEIYDKLQNRGIGTFIDDQDLEVGDPISQNLLTAIENSRFAIVVLSPNYASSTWCLEELVKICECMEDFNRILPLFYNVDPADVRHQKNTFKVAFAKHEESGRHNSKKLQQWRDALNKVASFSGWNLDNYKNDRELVDAIVVSVYRRVLPTAFQSTGDFTVFESTKQAMDQVMNALEDKKVAAVGVYGMGGVGKTTLVEHVGQEVRKQGLFDHVIMAGVNQAPDVRKIQGMLADGLGIIWKDEGEDMRASRLSTEIMRRNKTLIILDNVWEIIDLASVGIPSYNMLKSCNSKVLLTTRIKNVCHAMRIRSQETITLNILSPEDSWILFRDYADKSFESTDFESVARKVAKECGGLPIALIAVARALGDKDMEDWELAAEQLEKSEAANLDDKGDAFKCIKLSYNFLKDENSKACFLLCCLFPHDYDIPIEDLFKYGVGKGLFKGARTMQEARKKASSVAKHLKASSLLLDSEIDGCVKMHDVVRDTAIQITQSGDDQGYLVEAGCGLKKWPTRLDEGYSAISLMLNDIRKLPEELVCPKLEMLLLQANVHLDQIPDAFFKGTSSLRVLDLSSTSISSLSESSFYISNLQGLYLDSCRNLSDFSVLKYFKKLEILSMKDYPLAELPTEIGNLTNLRVLDVSGVLTVSGGILSVPTGVISKLCKLQELCLECGFWYWGSQVEETTNAQFDEVTSLSNLNTLKVCIFDANCIPREITGGNLSWTYFDIRITRYGNFRDGLRYSQTGVPAIVEDKDSRSLVLDTTIAMLPRWFVEVVTENTERLTYENVIGLNNILMEYHQGLHSLKYLSVIGPNESLETLMLLEAIPNVWRSKPVFEKLEELHLERTSSLKELCSGELPSGSLSSLKILEVSDCPNLGNVLLPSKLLQRLTNLEHLSCYGMPGMKYVFGCEGLKLKQSKLREMTLMKLDAVKSICNGPAPPAMFQALKSIYIFRCKFTEALFTFDVALCLSKLEDIFIESCPNLERLVEASKQKTVLEKLERLGLVGLPMLDSGSTDNEMVCPSLQYLYVRKCPRFQTSASNFGSKYLVKFNDESQYLFPHEMISHIQRDQDSPWNLCYSGSEVFNAAPLDDEMDELEQRMLEMLARRPDIQELINEFKANVPVGLPDILLETFKPSSQYCALKTDLLEAGIPNIVELMPGLVEYLPPPVFVLTSEKIKQLPEYVKSKRGISRTPEGIDATLEFIDLMPEMLAKFPSFMLELIETIKSCNSEELNRKTYRFGYVLTPQEKDQVAQDLEYLAENLKTIMRNSTETVDSTDMIRNLRIMFKR